MTTWYRSLGPLSELGRQLPAASQLPAGTSDAIRIATAEQGAQRGHDAVRYSVLQMLLQITVAC
jgi:hypothetical protein